MAEELLTIGELADRTGVATSALRYWEDLGVLPAPRRVGGQRRYPPSAVRTVGAILVLRDAGFTLRDVRTFLAGGDRRGLARRKLTELDERITQAEAARTAIAHALECPHDDITECPNHTAVVTARLAGVPLGDAHRH